MGFNRSEKYWSNWMISPSRGEKKSLKPPPRDSPNTSSQIQGFLGETPLENNCLLCLVHPSSRARPWYWPRLDSSSSIKVSSEISVDQASFCSYRVRSFHLIATSDDSFFWLMAIIDQFRNIQNEKSKWWRTIPAVASCSLQVLW